MKAQVGTPGAAVEGTVEAEEVTLGPGVGPTEAAAERHPRAPPARDRQVVLRAGLVAGAVTVERREHGLIVIVDPLELRVQSSDAELGAQPDEARGPEGVGPDVAGAGEVRIQRERIET